MFQRPAEFMCAHLYVSVRVYVYVYTCGFQASPILEPIELIRRTALLSLKNRNESRLLSRDDATNERNYAPRTVVRIRFGPEQIHGADS